MLSTIGTLRTKVRALVNDIVKSEKESFTYTNSAIFILAEENIEGITQITKNGTLLDTGEYSFSSTTNEVTIAPETGNELSNGDVIIVTYTFYKYSTTELDEWIRASLVWMSVKDATEKDFEIEDGDIFPTPDNRTLDLIVLIASILINPNWSEYRLPNLTVRYPRRFSKEEKIEKLIGKFTIGLGVSDILDWD